MMSPKDPPLFDSSTQCQGVAAHLHRYVEGELDPVRAQLVRTHTKACPRCADEVAMLELEKLWVIESALETPELSARATERAMAPIRKMAKRDAQRRRTRVISIAAGLIVAVTVGIQTTALLRPTPAAPQVMLNDSPMAPSETVTTVSKPATPVPAVTPRVERQRVAPSRIVDAGPSTQSNAVLASYNPVSKHSAPRRLRPFASYPPGIAYLPARSNHEVECYHGAPETPQIVIRRRLAKNAARSSHARGTAPRASKRTILIGISMGPRRARSRHVTLPATMKLVKRFIVPANLDNAIAYEPCVADPNADGKTDLDDVAYGFQVLYGAQAPSAVEPDVGTIPESDCDTMCLKA